MKQMFQKGAPAADFDMIIGQSSSIDGDIKSGGSIRIDGRVNGSIEAEGDVIIGTEADVFGSITGASIELSGKVEGDIHSGGLLKIHATGLLRGDIEVMSFVIEEGGAFEGQCNINTKGLPPKQADRNDDKAGAEKPGTVQQKQSSSQKNNTRQNSEKDKNERKSA